MSSPRTCATRRWPGRLGIGSPEKESGATGLLAGISGLEVIVGVARAHVRVVVQLRRTGLSDVTT